LNAREENFGLFSEAESFIRRCAILERAKFPCSLFFVSRQISGLDGLLNTLLGRPFMLCFWKGNNDEYLVVTLLKNLYYIIAFIDFHLFRGIFYFLMYLFLTYIFNYLLVGRF
jgi:hypothetical protein